MQCNCKIPGLRTLLFIILSFFFSVSIAFALAQEKIPSAEKTAEQSYSAPSDTTAKSLKKGKKKEKKQKGTRNFEKTDTLTNGDKIVLKGDSTGKNIVISLDSAKTDTARKDSAKKKKDGFDAPVQYQADDSSTYVAATKLSTLYGNGKVTFQDMAAVFATYAYKFDENGNVVVGDRTEWSYGRFGRFQGMSQNLSYTFSNSTFSKRKKSGNGGPDTNTGQNADDEDTENTEDTETNVDPDLADNMNSKGNDKGSGQVDPDGYLKFSIPWTFSVSYGISMRENTSAKINPRNMRYPYKFTQTMNFSGNIGLSKGWNVNYSSGYDFNYHQLSMTTASLSRDLHCFSMSCSIVLKPYTSFNFTFRAKMSTLADLLKWEKRSSYSSNIDWY